MDIDKLTKDASIQTLTKNDLMSLLDSEFEFYNFTKFSFNQFCDYYYNLFISESALVTEDSTLFFGYLINNRDLPSVDDIARIYGERVRRDAFKSLTTRTNWGRTL